MPLLVFIAPNMFSALTALILLSSGRKDTPSPLILVGNLINLGLALHAKLSYAIASALVGRKGLYVRSLQPCHVDSQSREPAFESPLLLFFSLNIFALSTRPSSPRCINEYLAIDSIGISSEQFPPSNCSVAECFPEKSNWYRNEQVCQGWSIKHDVRSKGLDTAL